MGSDSLNTFGSILTFAINLEDTAREFYEKLSMMAEQPIPSEVLKELVEGNSKRRDLLERTRRESVVEMILEPISGLYRAEYSINTLCAPDRIRTCDVGVAIELEGRIRQFYSDSANKTKFLPEVNRTLDRLARNSAEREAHLRNLQNRQS